MRSLAWRRWTPPWRPGRLARPADAARRAAHAGCTSPRRRCRRARSPASTPARASSTASSARCGGTSGSPTATSRSCRGCGPATARGRRSTARRTTGPTITLPRRYRTKGVVLHELAHWALGHRLRAPAPRSHVRARPARRHRRVLRRRPRERRSRRRTRSTACTSASPPRVGPDGRLRYGWDERLRLGKRAGAARVVHHARRRTRRRHRHASRATSAARRSCGSRRADGTIVRVPTSAVWDVARCTDGNPAGDLRRVPRQPRDRDLEVRRVRDHRLGVDAGGVDPLGRRHRQPGPAVPRRPAAAGKAPTAEHPFGFGTERYFWAFVVALVLFTLGSLFALVRGHREAASTPSTSTRRSWPTSCSASPSCSRRSSLRTARREATADRARAGRGGGSSARRRTPSSRSCCSRTPARSSGCFIALVGITPGRDHRRRPLGRGRQHRHRPAARRHRGRARDRDEEPADRRVGRAARSTEQIRAAILDGPEVVAHHPPAHACTSVPTTCCVAAKLEFTVRHDARARRRDRHRRGARANLGADRPAHLRRARPLPSRDRRQRSNGDRGHPMADDSAATAAAVDTLQRSVQPSRRRRGDGSDDRRLRVREHVASERANATRVRPRCAPRGRSSSPRRPTAHFDAEDVIVTGDRCVVQWRYTWTNDDGTDGARARRRRDPRARRQGRREVRLREGLSARRRQSMRRSSAR